MHIKHRAAQIYGVAPFRIDGVEWGDGQSRYKSLSRGPIMAKTAADDDCQLRK